MTLSNQSALPLAVLDALPTPVLVKDADTRYVWVNTAFEELFSLKRDDIIGNLDVDLFKYRQAAQCNGGDLRVLESGSLDEAEETLYDPQLGPRQMITRKSRVLIDDEHYLVGIMHDITDVTETNQRLLKLSRELEEQAQELNRLATQDSLTGCLNRRALFDTVDELGHEAQPVGLLAMDLDEFKTVNDNHGHGGGDAVLLQFVDIVRASVREGDVVARLGGEEFAVLLPGATSEETFAIAQRIREKTEQTQTPFDGDAIACTVSVGAVHHAGDETVEIDHLIRAADAMLYQAKDLGRNRVVTG